MENLLVRTISNIHAEIDLPVRVFWERYGTPEYWKKLEYEYIHEAKDMEDFIRDHRSRDGYGISIIKEYTLSCKFCGHEYPDDYDGILDCCDEAIDAQQEYIKRLVNE